ncbi:MAG: M20/M25/M40 family metallo-hydrolase, partial [Halobacteriales archaeon]
MAESDGTRSPPVDTDMHERPIELLQELIRFDTTNPPGDERACVEWIGELLDTYGLEYETYANDPDRLNLVSRQSGGDAPALLLYGHVDVVPTEGQDWTHPPFEGVIEDDLVWGRGALDMKGGVAMMTAAYLRAAVDDIDLGGDLLLCILSDEEAGGSDGAAFMIEEHPEAFEGVEYAIGEFGGFSTEIAGERFYPIQMNEKVSCPMQATFTGPAGHGSSAHSGGAMAKMAKAITAVDESRLPVHIVPTVESMIEGMAEELSPPTEDRLRALLDPERTDDALDELAANGEETVADMLDPLLHNIANPTVINTGEKVNV